MTKPNPLVKTFLKVALIEAASYLALVGASIGHRAFDMGDYVPIVGLIHGSVFLVYLALGFGLRCRYGWDSGTIIVLVLASVIPLGTLLVERKVAANPMAPDLLHGWIMAGSGRNGG